MTNKLNELELALNEIREALNSPPTTKTNNNYHQFATIYEALRNDYQTKWKLLGAGLDTLTICEASATLLFDMLVEDYELDEVEQDIIFDNMLQNCPPETAWKDIRPI